MKMNAYIAGAGMTRFGIYLDRGLKSLVAEAVEIALADAGIAKHELQAAYTGTAAAGIITGQVLVPGEVVLRNLGIGRIPVINCENACATSSTAFQQAAAMVSLGVYDVALVVGYEKLYSADKQKTFSVFTGAVDVEDMDGVLQRLSQDLAASGVRADLSETTSKRSIFMDVYARMAHHYMQRSGATPRHFAMVSAKNSLHGSLNPKAQYQDELSVEQVLAAPMISDPLTLPMCSPIGDGAAALVLVSERKARQLGLHNNGVRILSSVLATGWDYTAQDTETAPEYAARLCYEESGIGPQYLDVVELHDASAPAEVIYYELLGLAAKNEGYKLLESGATRLGGRCVVSPSGGLLRKGHPIGASGCGQLVELTDQLRGRCGKRQVQGARHALAENGGGWIGNDVAAIVITALRRGE